MYVYRTKISPVKVTPVFRGESATPGFGGFSASGRRGFGSGGLTTACRQTRQTDRSGSPKNERTPRRSHDLCGIAADMTRVTPMPRAPAALYA
jgi:hypothetical protein